MTRNLMPTKTAMDTAPLTCEVISNTTDWQKLATSWGRLLKKTPESTPWQSMEWLMPWWKHLSGSRRLMIVVVRRGDTPCLILPLQIAESPGFGIPVRFLEPIGMPDDINRPAFGLGLREETAALDCALETIWKHRAEWDGIRLDEKERSDREVESLAGFGERHGLAVHITDLHPCPRLELGQDWEVYLATRGRLLRRNLRTYRKQLETNGPVQLQIFETADEVNGAFDVFLRIHGRSWKHDAGLSLSREDYQQCYREFLVSMAAKGRARVLIMHSGAYAVAGAIAAMDDNVYYGAQIAHDAEFNRFSPGTLLESLELEALMQEKRFQTYDFFGAALSNKRRWTEDLRPTCRVLLLRKNLRARLFDRWYFWCKPRLQRVRRKLRNRTGQKPVPDAGGGLESSE